MVHLGINQYVFTFSIKIVKKGLFKNSHNQFHRSFVSIYLGGILLVLVNLLLNFKKQYRIAFFKKFLCKKVYFSKVCIYLNVVLQIDEVGKH